jgi:hypothetical protein
MLWLLYFGRLEEEKWFDGIIDMIEIFEKKNQKLPFKLFVFGSGSREKKIQELSQTHKNIHFFGRQNLKTIKRYVENCQYCLMPSECLESFGLSALNALQRWLAPIGYAKWWLKDFIDAKLDLTHQKWKTTGEKLYQLVNALVIKPLVPSSLSQIPAWYSKDNRIVRFHALAGKEVQKIIIVSDFINKIWGIETYINDVKELLEQHGYEVELCWWKVPSWTIGKLIKYLWFITGLGNFWETIKLQCKIKKTKPDLIRYNSVMRYLGRAPIWASKNSTAKKWMMFHDLGYFYPFPSQLTSEDQIKTPLDLNHFLASYTTKNQLKKLAIMGKYFSLRLIKKQLKKTIDTFLVPANFMQEIVHKSHKIEKEKIKVFPHFIQE